MDIPVYQRFQNTNRFMRDCIDHLDDDDLSDEEKQARKKFIKMCIEVTYNYEEQDEEE